MDADAELEEILHRGFPGCRIERCGALGGGVSARAARADLMLADGTRRRVVVRRPSSATAEQARRIARNEYELLKICSSLGLSAPAPCFLDFGAGAIVLEYVPGKVEFAPSSVSDLLRQMAAELARIHAVETSAELDFLPRRSESAERDLLCEPDELDHGLGEAELRSALRTRWPWPQHNREVLLHGDYWPGNLVWQSRKLVAVLDWEEAALGDPLADLAIARLDVLWAFGEAAMHEFTDHYRKHTHVDWTNLACWELCAALRPMSNLARWASVYAAPPIARADVTERSMAERHRAFVAQTLRRLDAASGAVAPV